MSYKPLFSRALGLDPERLHFAAHSHHLWPDASFDAQVQAWAEANRFADRKWELVFGEVIPEAQKHVAKELNLPSPDSLIFNVDSGPKGSFLEVDDDTFAAANWTDIQTWARSLRRFNVFFCEPLDLDYSMLMALQAAYSAPEPGRSGPSPAGEPRDAVLGDGGIHALYDSSQDGLLRWYRYLFLGRGKPSTHVRVLSGLDSPALASAAPEELKALLGAVAVQLDPPRDYAILVKQKAEAVDTELRAPMAASGLRIRNESALVGKVPLQDLLSDSLCRLVVAALRLGSVQRSPAAWQYLSAAVSALRAIPPGDDAADARAEAALSRFLAGLRKDMTETAPSAEAAVNIAEAVLTFLDPAAVQRTYVEYGAGNLLEIVVEGLLQHLMASATGVSTWSECLDAFEGLDQIPLMTVHKSKGLEYDTIVFMGLDDQAWWAHKPGDKEGLAAFFVALSRAKQRAIFAFCQQRGQRSKVAELYALLGQAGVPEIAI